MGSSPASHAHVAPTNLKRDGLCASLVVGALPPSTRGPSPSKTVTPKVSGLLTPSGDIPTPTTSQKNSPNPQSRPKFVVLPSSPNQERPSCLTNHTTLLPGPTLTLHKPRPGNWGIKSSPNYLLLQRAGGTFPSILLLSFCTGLHCTQFLKEKDCQPLCQVCFSLGLNCGLARKGWHPGRNFQPPECPGCMCAAHPVPRAPRAAILTPASPCLQSSAPLGTTTTPVPIAASAVPWGPISPTSARTSVPAVQETQALTSMAPPVWPSARVRGRPGWGKGARAWEQGAQEEACGGVKPSGSGLGRGWAGKSHPLSLPSPLSLRTGFWAGPCSSLSLETG